MLKVGDRVKLKLSRWRNKEGVIVRPYKFEAGHQDGQRKAWHVQMDGFPEPRAFYENTLKIIPSSVRGRIDAQLKEGNSPLCLK